MLTDAHCHPFDLLGVFPGAREEMQNMGILCAASASSGEEFALCETLAAESGRAFVLPCFALHPQLPSYLGQGASFDDGLALLETLAAQGRLAALGETGFDLYGEKFRAGEKTQDALFAAHMETALRYDLPLVIHARRAMHKIFAHSEKLKKCRAVVFHSWAGTFAEGGALLRRGINAYFSFGTTILLNHKEAKRCCAAFSAERLLLETDAPYQPLRGTGRAYSSWRDLPLIINAAAALRREAGAEISNPNDLEKIVESNFRAVFAAGFRRRS